MKESEIRQLIHESDQRECGGRFERLKILLSIEETQHPFPVSALTYEYYEEARLCWYMGAFVSTIVMVQLSFEELFRAHYRAAHGVGGELSSGKKIDRSSFFDLIEEARNDGWISGEEAKMLHNLRENIRNQYVHVKDVKIDENGKQDLSHSDFSTILLKIRAPDLIGPGTEEEAAEAIRLLVTALPEISRRSGGL